jgi:hypothetical protein
MPGLGIGGGLPGCEERLTVEAVVKNAKKTTFIGNQAEAFVPFCIIVRLTMEAHNPLARDCAGILSAPFYSSSI